MNLGSAWVDCLGAAARLRVQPDGTSGAYATAIHARGSAEGWKRAATARRGHSLQTRRSRTTLRDACPGCQPEDEGRSHPHNRRAVGGSGHQGTGRRSSVCEIGHVSTPSTRRLKSVCRPNGNGQVAPALRWCRADFASSRPRPATGPLDGPLNLDGTRKRPFSRYFSGRIRGLQNRYSWVQIHLTASHTPAMSR